MREWKPDLLPYGEHNRRLLGNVHPTDWQNPDPQPVYNLVVVGAGTAGLISAIATASLGGKVALIERHLMGGDCLNVGCVPSKSFLRPARLAHEMKNAAGWGLSGCKVRKEDFARVMERLRRIRADISRNDSAARYRDAGVDVFLGEARFTAPEAGEMIGEISTAMAAGMGLGELDGVIHPYPTQAEAIKRVAGLYKRTRLTPPRSKNCLQSGLHGNAD